MVNGEWWLLYTTAFGWDNAGADMGLIQAERFYLLPPDTFGLPVLLYPRILSRVRREGIGEYLWRGYLSRVLLSCILIYSFKSELISYLQLTLKKLKFLHCNRLIIKLINRLAKEIRSCNNPNYSIYYNFPEFFLEGKPLILSQEAYIFVKYFSDGTCFIILMVLIKKSTVYL